MSLIHYYIIDIQDVDVGTEELGGKALGGDVKELEIPVCGIVQGKVDFAPGHTRIHGKGLDSPAFKVLDLVFHKGYQGSDNQG